MRACKNICALYETEKQEGYGEMASKYVHTYICTWVRAIDSTSVKSLKFKQRKEKKLAHENMKMSSAE